MFDVGFYIIDYYGKAHYFKAIRTNMKPNKNDDVKINGIVYTVKETCIDYDDNSVHVFIVNKCVKLLKLR